MSIRRWLRRWFGEPEPRNPRRPTLCGRVDRVWTVQGTELVFWCSEPHEHPGQHRAVNVEGIVLTWNRSTPRDRLFRDTGSGDRDAGVDALVSEDRR